MNENLENQLAKVIEKSLEIAEKTGEFVMDQAPDLIREFLLWHTVESGLSMFICVLSIFVIYHFRVLVSEKTVEDENYMTKFLGRWWDEGEMPIIFYCIFGGVGVFSAVVFFAQAAYRLIKIIVAPKLYLIEYFLK